MSTMASEAKQLAGMGCIPHPNGVAFRVWAPHAEEIYLVGSFNNWSEDSHSLVRQGDHWYLDVPEAQIGDEYYYLIVNGQQRLKRIDPYAREVTNSVGNSVVHDPEFDWEGDDFHLAAHNKLVIYEMHVGTFNRAKKGEIGTFDQVVKKLDYLRRLGVNAIQLMPTVEFAGDQSWGYNPAHIFAVESVYGGPGGLKELVKQAHRHDIGVILDVVYNHFGPSDLDLWQFDGWSPEEGKGGIYFFNDWRAATPWGDSRPDYGRGEVRSFIFDNAMMWLEDYHMDGLRYDMTLFMRSVDGTPDREIPEGWSLAQWINREARARFPGKILIAEDMQNNPWLTKPPEWGGAGFHSQWDAEYVHPIRAAVQGSDDATRSMEAVKNAICHRYNLDAFERVVYSESHDEVANGKARVPTEIDPKDPRGWFAQKRSTLASALTLTAPGIPMLFQGQEFMRGKWFDDSRGIDWQQEEDCRGIVRLYRDLIRLRLNKFGSTKGLTGQRVEMIQTNDHDKVIAFRRWAEGGKGDDVVVVTNFANRHFENYQIGVPAPGIWHVRFNGDSSLYSEDFDNAAVDDVEGVKEPWNGLPFSIRINLSPYTALVFSQDAEGS